MAYVFPAIFLGFTDSTFTDMLYHLARKNQIATGDTGTMLGNSVFVSKVVSCWGRGNVYIY